MEGAFEAEAVGCESLLGVGHAFPLVGIPANPVHNVMVEFHSALFIEWILAGDCEFCQRDNRVQAPDKREPKQGPAGVHGFDSQPSGIRPVGVVQGDDEGAAGADKAGRMADGGIHVAGMMEDAP